MTAAARDRESERMERMLFVTCAKVWRQQLADGSSHWAAIGVIHPFVQTEPALSNSPGEALFAAYTAWKQQNT